MSSDRLLRLTVLALLGAMLFVPALTQPARRLSPAPVNQGSSFSRVGELATDRSSVSPTDVSVAETIDPVVMATDSQVAVPAPPAAVIPLPTVHRLPPTPLRAPPATSLP